MFNNNCNIEKQKYFMLNAGCSLKSTRLPPTPEWVGFSGSPGVIPTGQKLGVKTIGKNNNNNHGRQNMLE